MPPKLLLFLPAIAAAAAVAAVVQTRRRQRAACRKRRPGLSKQLLAAATGQHIKAPHVFTRYSPMGSKDSDAISILSWNVLSDALATPRRLPWVMPSALEWCHRARLLAAELRAVAADIVALQEVEGTRWDEIRRDWLPGWCGVLQEPGRGGDSGRKDLMLLALLWKPRFTLVWAEHRSRALIVQLAWTDSQGQAHDLWVVNLHLEGSPYRPNDRVSQARNALVRLQTRQEVLGMNPTSCHVVILGDFNSGKSETVWRFLRRGLLEGGSTEAYLPNVEVTRTTLAHPYALQDCYAEAGSPVPWTRKAPRVAATIDFIWASNHWAVAGVYDPLHGTKHAPVVSSSKIGGGGSRHKHQFSLDAPADSKAGSSARSTHSTVSGDGSDGKWSGSGAAKSHAGSCVGSSTTSKRQKAGQGGGSSSSTGPGPAVTVNGRGLAQSTRGENTGLPNMLCPSDHLPLGVLLQLKPAQAPVGSMAASASADLGVSRANRITDSSTGVASDDGAGSPLASGAVSMLGSSASLVGLSSRQDTPMDDEVA